MKIILQSLILLFSITAPCQEKQTFFFDFDIDKVNSNSLSKFDDWVAKNKEAVIEKVYGYTDSVGSILYNDKLSVRRAKDAVKRLKEAGINISENIEIKGFGENFEQDAEQAKNRKVEIYYYLPIIEKEPAKPETTGLSKKIDNSKTGDKLRLDNLNFYGGTANLLPESRPVLEELLKIMQENPNLKIDIHGHVCCYSNNNHPVSKERARFVYNYLKSNGIDTSRISFKDFGGSSPIYRIPERNSDEQRANRRVEIEIIAN